MKTPSTVSLRLPKAMPVAGLAVEVVEGADRGTTCHGVERVTVGTASGNDLVVSDETVSRFHAEFIASEDGVLVIDHGSTNGTRIGSARVERARADYGSILQLGRTRLRLTDGRRGIIDLHGGDAFGKIRGRSNVMRRVMAKVSSVAQSTVPVLLIGETGTGKELIARAVHDHSDREDGPFETVDCGALSAQLFASELFGHEKGAFTGAHDQRRGAFERAHGGTLFLDEIGEMPSDLQSHLLGVLERRRFRRVGGAREVEVDVRIVAATNRDLRKEVNMGRFRLDLYYRIAAARVDVPPLRDRPDDVPLLVEHFLRVAGHDGPVSSIIDTVRMAALQTHAWSGNVRELRNFVETLLITGDGELDSLVLDSTEPASGARGTYKEARSRVLRQFEQTYLAELLRRADGNVSKAARIAKMDRSHLTDLLRRHQLR